MTSMRVGRRTCSIEPVPTAPYLFQPHAQISPRVSSTLCRPPLCSSQVKPSDSVSCRGNSTCTGREEFTQLLFPSCPYLLSPQANRSPPERTMM